MKITACFYTPDEAAHAAGEAKRNLGDNISVSISGNPAYMQRGFYTDDEFTEKRGVYKTSVICNSDTAKTVSGILINRGGHEISLSD